MKQSYLIQRADFKKSSDCKGLDGILFFDYMGSAEFEFGKLPESLKRIREAIIEYDFFDEMIKCMDVTIYCQREYFNDVRDNIIKISNDKIILKQYINFFRPEAYHCEDFCWDIENDFMFWRKDKKFCKKFGRLIGGGGQK